MRLEVVLMWGMLFWKKSCKKMKNGGYYSHEKIFYKKSFSFFHKTMVSINDIKTFFLNNSGSLMISVASWYIFSLWMLLSDVDSGDALFFGIIAGVVVYFLIQIIPNQEDKEGSWVLDEGAWIWSKKVSGKKFRESFWRIWHILLKAKD